MIDVRNSYGFPVMQRIEKAREYAAEARERNKPVCTCEACKQTEMLPAVLRILGNWGKK